VLYALAFLLLFAGADEPERKDSVEESLKRFVSVFAVVQENAAEPISTGQAIYEGALPGMLRQLDPHSVFFTPGQFEQLREMEKSTRKGFGSIVSLLPGRVIVLQTLPGTPSARSGLEPGDEIVAINNIRLDFLGVEQLVQLLSEARQHQVQIQVRRPGNSRLIPLMLTPEDVEASSVDRAFHIEPGIGYIRVTTFDVKTGEQIRDAIEKLGGDKLNGLVLDLRNNPGGILQAAIHTCSLFLKPGETIVSVRGRSMVGETATAPQDAKPYQFPLTVLINNKSASASEIVAGAVEDTKRGKVLGEQSFGKGLVQSVFPLSQGAGLALTTAFYYTPAGRSIQKALPGQLAKATAQGVGGITPDEFVYPEAPSRLRVVIDASGAATEFATTWLQRSRPALNEQFEVDNSLLDEFQTALSARNIRPGIADWSRDREWIRNRLRQEIFNLGLGVAKGDEVEARQDPVVKAAVASLRSGG
jgi:carboxyl-terminal processing protease